MVINYYVSTYITYTSVLRFWWLKLVTLSLLHIVTDVRVIYTYRVV